MFTQTLRGPGGIRIELDATEIVPDDPGAGTPAMVSYGDHTGTFWCVNDTGELGCGDYELTDAQRNWVRQQEDTVNEFVERHTIQGA